MRGGLAAFNVAAADLSTHRAPYNPGVLRARAPATGFVMRTTQLNLTLGDGCPRDVGGGFPSTILNTPRAAGHRGLDKV